MTLKDLKDVLNFNAFLPEADDSSASWRRRFQNKKSLMLSMNRTQIRTMAYGKNGRLQELGEVEGEWKETIPATAEEWKRQTEGGWCGVSLNTRYVISLEMNLPRRKGVENFLKSNPRQALGSKYEKGKRYAVTHNAESNTSLLLSCDEEQIKKLEKMLDEAGLRVARICVGTYVMLRHLLVEVGQRLPKGQPIAPDAGFLYVVCNFGSVCILSQRGVQWLDLRSRTDVFEDDPAPVLELLAPFRQQMAPPLQVALLCHDMLPPFATAIETFFPGAEFTDFTQPGHIWKLLYEG